MRYTEYAKYCNEGKLLATLSKEIQEVINRVCDDVDENFDFTSNPELHPDYFVKHNLMIWKWSDIVKYVTEHRYLSVDEIDGMYEGDVVYEVERDYFWFGEQDGLYYFMRG